MIKPFIQFADSQISSPTESSSSESSGGGTMDSLKSLFSGPVVWVVLGALIALILAIWLVRRIIKAKPNASIVLSKKGQIVAIVGNEEGEVAKKFAAPFVTTIGSPITRKGNVFASDQLLINDGPDKLYRLSFSLGYDVTDVKAFYACKGDFMKRILNDSLRAYAYEGNADKLLRTYVEEEKNLVALLNQAYEGKGINVTSFKINSIAPVTAK